MRSPIKPAIRRDLSIAFVVGLSLAAGLIFTICIVGDAVIHLTCNH